MVESKPSFQQEEARAKIAEGVELMKLGVTETIKSEVSHATAMGVIGAGVGVVAWAWTGKSESVWNWAKKFGRWGLVSGWFAASSNYNDYAHETGLPKVKWYDTLGASIIANRAIEEKGPIEGVTRPVRLVIPHLVTPISTLGVRTTISGIRDLFVATY